MTHTHGHYERSFQQGTSHQVKPSQNLDIASLSFLIKEGEVTHCEPLAWGSNYTYVLTLAGKLGQCLALYKPRRGERTLWDFPSGTLYRREYASYLISEALGWSFIPPTAIREGPHGIGSVQWFVPSLPEENYFTFGRERVPELQRIALFDVIANNADRKAGHCLLELDGKVWGIDHGLTFHALPKLRTVIWDFSGQSISSSLLQDLKTLRAQLGNSEPLFKELSELLDSSEIEALQRRIDMVLEAAVFPFPGPGRHIPWPPI
ncbi:MAG: SCO1664 family protein [Chloroflexi bacterium]|nr:SCO1664 family protein [Chloroflexota bacterium]